MRRTVGWHKKEYLVPEAACPNALLRTARKLQVRNPTLNGRGLRLHLPPARAAQNNESTPEYRRGCTALPPARAAPAGLKR